MDGPEGAPSGLRERGSTNKGPEDVLDHETIQRSFKRSLTVAERDGIQAALDAVDAEKESLEAEGLSQTSFFVGIVNVVLTTYVFAKSPWHLWLLYGAECAVLIPAWFATVSRIHRGALFVLDFCWVANIVFGAFMLLSFCGPASAWLRRYLFLTFFACAQGPLGWACILLHNGIVFHSVEKSTSLFIHFMPIVVSFTLRYHSGEVGLAWPERFPRESELLACSAADVYLHGLAFYLGWWSLHGAWLLTLGVGCPRRGHATVFDGLYTKHGLGKVFRRATGLQGIRSHAAVYLLLHLLAVSAAFAWAALCFRFIQLHIAFGCLVFLSAAWNGAGYYDYIVARKYVKVVKNVLADRQRAHDSSQNASPH